MTLYNKKISIVLFLVLAVALVGCSAVPVVEEPVQATVPLTATQTEIPSTPIPTALPPTATPRLTWTMTPEPPPLVLSNWESLEAGEYVAYAIKQDAEYIGIDVISLSTLETNQLSELFGWPLTSDGHYLNIVGQEKKKIGVEVEDVTLVVLNLWNSEIGAYAIDIHKNRLRLGYEMAT
jgi:hypothetical protein